MICSPNSAAAAPRWQSWLLLAGTLLAATLAFLFLRGPRQSAVWMGPYLSGAANWRPGGPFLVDEDELKIFNTLNPAAQDAYHFRRSDHAVEYGANPIGYVYLIVLAKALVPFAGDQVAIVLLQLGVHAALCSWVFFSSAFPRRFQLGFFFLYALNPVVLGFAAYNHYYFWQAVPSFFVLYLGAEPRVRWLVAVFAAVATSVALTARPTPILLVPVLGWLAYQRFGGQRAAVVLALIVGIFVAINRPTEKNIFHTMYIGLGAYANPDHIQLSDDAGYALYEAKTGDQLSASPGGNYYQKNVAEQYRQITKDRYFEILRAHPLLLVRNALLNIAQACLFGYQTHGGDWINFAAAVFGAAFALWLAWRRVWFYLIAILLVNLTFTPYYPPIRAYMYGAYSLIVFALLYSLRLGGSPVWDNPDKPTRPERSLDRGASPARPVI